MIALRACLKSVRSSRNVRHRRPAAMPVEPQIEYLENRNSPSATVARPILVKRAAGNDTTPVGVGYTPSQIRTAYDINRIAVGNSGAGQAIAIVDAYNNPNIFNDLDVFDQAMTTTTGGPSLYSSFGSAASVLTVYDQNGNVLNVANTSVSEDPSGGWEGEEALDVQWAHAIAPAARVDLVESNSDSSADLYAADQTAARLPSVSVVSNSWGEGEYTGENADDATFSEPAGHQGVTFLFSSGDYNTGEYPAFSPNVISVGGTTLYLNADNTIATEEGWSTSYDYGWGTGGGTSVLEAEPGYQFGTQDTGYRTAPDVSLVADPLTGVAIYDSYNNPADSAWEEVGGTSVACPCWAGLLGIANAGRVANGKPTFGSDGKPQAALTALYSLPAGDFNDITVGFINSDDGNTYYAGAGYDEVTGRGSPVADHLVQDLVNFTPVSQPVDPEFETPGQGSGSGAYTYDPIGSPWTFTGWAGLAGNGSGFTAGNPDAPAGNQVAFLQDNGTMSQSMTFIAGTYVIWFDAAQRANWQASFQTVGVYVDNNLVAALLPNSTSYFAYGTSPFNVAAGGHTLRFVGLDPNGGDNTVFIDQIVVQSTPANLPVDAGFESPGQGSGPGAYTYDPTGSPWTFAGLAGLTGNGSDFTAGNPYAPGGNQVAFLQDNGVIGQNVNFTAGTYVITFDAAQRANWQASFQTFGVYVDGVLIAAIEPGSTNYSGYSTPVFNVAAGSHTIDFVGLDPNGGDNTAFLDDVAIQSDTVNQPFDPGFETPAQGTGPGAYSYRPTGSPWTFTGGAGLAGNGSGFTVGNPDAPEGSQVAFLQGTGTISQSVNITGGNFLITLEAAQRANWQASFQTLGIYVDNNMVGTILPGSTSYVAYSTRVFSLAAGGHTLRMVGLDPNGGDNTAFIDAISIQSMPPNQPADPGFETPGQGSGSGAYTYDQAGSAWTFTGTAGLAGNGSAFTAGNPNAPEGNQVAFLQGTGAVSQIVDFTTGSYVITFDAAQRANWQASTQTIGILVDGSLVGTITANGSSYVVYASNSFTVATGMHKLTFMGLDPLGGDNTVFIDQVAMATV